MDHDGAPTLGFVRNGLLRAGIETDPEGFLREAEGPAGLRILIAGDQAILRMAGADGTALLAVRRDLPVLERVVLGRHDGRPVVGLLHAADAIPALTADPVFQAHDLRSIAVQGLVPPDELGMLAQARCLLGWHARHRFCPNCGQPTATACGGLRRDCAACGTQHFPRTDPVSIMLVWRGDSCLLGRQTRFLVGSYSCLAGFISPGETIEDAVRREVLEEAGIAVGAVRYVASQPWPFPSSLMIGCLGEALDETITLDQEELEDARWFHRDEVAAMLERRHPDGLFTPPPMAIAHFLMRAWLEGGPA